MIETPMATLPGPESSPPSSPDGLKISESLAPPRELKAAVTADISFDGLLKEPLLLKEDLKDGCGGQLWPAGMALAKYLLSRHATDLSDKTMWVLLHRGISISSCFVLIQSSIAWNLELEVDLLDSLWHEGVISNSRFILQTKNLCFP